MYMYTMPPFLCFSFFIGEETVCDKTEKNDCMRDNASGDSIQLFKKSTDNMHVNAGVYVS